MKPRLLSLLCSCVPVALGAIPAAANEGVAVGVHVDNPQRLSPTDQETVLDQIQAAGVRVIRAPLKSPWSGANYAPAIQFIRRAYERGIKTVLIVHLQYRESAQRRPAIQDMPEMWPSYPLSSADPERFKAVFVPLFEKLEELGITFSALELGNEINGTAFNGDFPIPGEGKVFGLQDLTRDPEARQIAKGYRAYLQTLEVLKDIRDHSRLNVGTPILSAGLVDAGFARPRPNSKTDAVTISATIEYLRANGLDQLVDAYGVHTYSWGKTPASRRNQLEQETLVECHPPGQGKPCWITEWGLPAASAACPGNDAPRATLMEEMLGDFRQFVRKGRLLGLIYYAWADGKYGVYRCGGLTEAGRVALDASYFE
jgi:hypothetical protein